MANKQQCLLEGAALNTECSTSDLTGNIIPNYFYQIILNDKGNPDHTAITVFAEIYYWYRPDKDGKPKFKHNAWQTSRAHFEEKFGYYGEKTRRAFVRLEELDLIRRERRSIKSYGYKYHNVLFIHLTKKALNLLQLGHNDNILPSSVRTSTQNEVEHISNTKNIENNRSMDLASNESKSGSNFLNLRSNIFLEDVKPTKQTQKDFSEEIVQDSAATFDMTKRTPRKVREARKITSSMALSDFLPISDKTCESLQIRSGREFNKNAINEILGSIAKKIPDRTFSNRRAFESYACKVLANELRQAELINNKDFRIRSNCSSDSLKTREIENFLEKIENSKSIEPKEIFKKKIASSFSNEKAYEIIGAYNHTGSVGDKMIISFSKHVELSETQEKTLISMALEVFGNYEYLSSKSVKIQIPDKIINSSNQNTRPVEKLPNNVWGRAREVLIQRLGIGIDKSWFSKLECSVSEKTKQIELRAPSNFIRDWIENHYGRTLTRTIEEFQFTLSGISAV